MTDKYTYGKFDKATHDALRVNPYAIPESYFDQLQHAIATNITEQKLKDMVIEPGFSVPEGYFNQLERRTLQRNNHLASASEAMPVPPGYFQQLQKNIMAKVAEQKLREKIIDPGFTVPLHYFDGLDSTIAGKVRQLQTQATPVRKMRTPSWMQYAAAACLALALGTIGYFQLSNNDASSNTKPLASVSDQEILNYLELHGTANDINSISEYLVDDLDERNIGERISDEDIEAYLNYTL